MILIIPGIFILIYSFKNFKRAITLFLVYEMFWYSSAKVIDLGTDKSITIGFLMTFVLTLNFLFLRGGFRIIRNTDFPFYRPFILMSFSFLISTFFSRAGFAAEIFRALVILFQSYYIVIVIWYAFSDINEYNKVLKMLLSAHIISCLYGLVEYVIKYNPLAIYKSSLSTTGIEFYDLSRARGYRLMATFEHPIAAGMMFALFLIFATVLLFNHKKNIKKNYKLAVGILLSSICILLTKMRAGIVFAFVGVLSVVNLKRKSFYKKILIVFVALLIISPIILKNKNIILSLFVKSAQTQVGGSSFQQRMQQLRAVLNLLKLSPITGLGEKFQQYINNYDTYMALGYESVWLEQTAKHGIIGIIANLYLAYYSIIKIPKKYQSRPAFFLAFAFWLTYSMTIITSFRMDIYYLIYFYFLKFSNKRMPN